MQEINSKDWENEVEKSDKPVIVDFYATWCGPCKQMAPLMEELEKEAGGKFKFVKFNAGDENELPMKLGIRAVPTLVLFDKKEEKARVTGMNSRDSIKKQLGM